MTRTVCHVTVIRYHPLTQHKQRCMAKAIDGIEDILWNLNVSIIGCAIVFTIGVKHSTKRMNILNQSINVLFKVLAMEMVSEHFWIITSIH